MATDQVMDGCGKQLYCELVVHIAVRLYEIQRQAPVCRETTKLKGHEFDDMAAGAFQKACRVLMEAGVVVPHPKFSTYKARFDIPGMRAFVSSNPKPSDSFLQRALSSFLAIAIDYGRFQPISATKQPFEIPEGFEKLFQLLIECGYAQRQGDLAQWTEKVAPAMYAATVWEDPEIVARWQRLHEAYLEELEAMWQTMPADICVRFFCSDPDEDDELGRVVARFWYDGKWQTEGLDVEQIEPSKRRHSELCARDLLKRFHGPGKKR